MTSTKSSFKQIKVTFTAEILIHDSEWDRTVLNKFFFERLDGKIRSLTCANYLVGKTQLITEE